VPRRNVKPGERPSTHKLNLQHQLQLRLRFRFCTEKENETNVAQGTRHTGTQRRRWQEKVFMVVYLAARIFCSQSCGLSCSTSGVTDKV